RRGGPERLLVNGGATSGHLQMPAGISPREQLTRNPGGLERRELHVVDRPPGPAGLAIPSGEGGGRHPRALGAAGGVVGRRRLVTAPRRARRSTLRGRGAPRSRRRRTAYGASLRPWPTTAGVRSRARARRSRDRRTVPMSPPPRARARRAFAPTPDPGRTP